MAFYGKYDMPLEEWFALPPEDRHRQAIADMEDTVWDDVCGIPGKLNYKEAGRDVICNASSFDRMCRLLALYGQEKIREATFLKLLGEIWTGCDFVGRYSFQFKALLGNSVTPAMMTRRELSELCKLPDTLTVYRGCYANNRDGLSWTLDKKVAEKFPFLARFWQPGQALLLEARIKKSRVIALKLCREESEVICSPRKIISVTELVQPVCVGV